MPKQASVQGQFSFGRSGSVKWCPNQKYKWLLLRFLVFGASLFVASVSHLQITYKWSTKLPNNYLLSPLSDAIGDLFCHLCTLPMKLFDRYVHMPAYISKLLHPWVWCWFIEVLWSKLLLVPGPRLKTKEGFVFEFAASKLTLNALQCHLIPVDWIYLFFKFVYDCESLWSRSVACFI